MVSRVRRLLTKKGLTKRESKMSKFIANNTKKKTYSNLKSNIKNNTYINTNNKSKNNTYINTKNNTKEQYTYKYKEQCKCYNKTV